MLQTQNWGANIILQFGGALANIDVREASDLFYGGIMPLGWVFLAGEC